MHKRQALRLRWCALALSSVMLAPALAACGIPGSGAVAEQQEPPTPTPLPPDPEVERPTYTVTRDVLEEAFETFGTITPVDLVRLSFKREGRVETVAGQRGDEVQAGAVLAELQQTEKLDELRDAQDAVVQAQRDVENARKAQEKAIRQAEIGLQSAQDDLKRLLPGGPDDPIRKAQDDLEVAQRAARDAGTSGSEAKTAAEEALVKAGEAVLDAQKARERAFWENDWAQRYGTDPKNPQTCDPQTNKCTPNQISEEQKQQFADALVQADRALRDAEQGVEKARREIDKSREKEILDNTDANDKVAEAQRALDLLLRGSSKEIIAAQRAVEEARLAVEEARAESFNSEIKAVEDAQRRVERAQKAVEDGRIIAPQNGQILTIGIAAGDTVEGFDPVVEIADPSQLEVAAELGAEQMRQLQEGQPAEVNLLAREDVIMPAQIRRLPAPYGSGGSGAIEEQDRTTRFQVLDTRGQTFEPGIKVRVRIVLQRKENVLVLPTEAIRSFEGRRFVIVREGDSERRVTVRTGIEANGNIEILEGLEEGDIVVGQ